MAENINTVHHRWIRETMPHMHFAIDATCGGGNDTLFLSTVADQVAAMDIQQEAVEKTRRKTSGCTNVTVYCHDHSQMKEIINEPADLICFNLGYLPYSANPLITSASTTIPALTAASELLKENGILSVACYIGHQGGHEEWEAVQLWIKSHCSHWKIRTYTDGRDNAPILYFMQKTKGE